MALEALLVDDDRDHARRVRGVLAALGARVASASTALEALNQLREQTFDLVLLKTDLPELDGRRRLSEIRIGALASKHAIFIAVAPRLDAGEIASYVRAGFLAAVPKPVQGWRLREIVYAVGLAERPVAATSDSAKVLAALAGELGLRLLDEIARRGEITVTALETDLGIPRQKLARDVKLLRDAGLISAERRGRETWYCARSEAARAAAHWMLEFADGLAGDGGV